MLSGGAYKVLLGSWVGLFSLLMIVPLVSGVVVAEVIGGVGLLVMSIFCVRWFRAAIFSDATHLVLRTPYRTRKLEWAHVKEARVVPTNGNRIIGIVRVTTMDGKRIRVDGVGNRWRRTGGDGAVYQMAAEINRRVVAYAERGADAGALPVTAPFM